MSDGSVFFATMKSQFAEQHRIEDRLDRRARLVRLERKLGRRRDHGPGWLRLFNVSWLLQLGARWLRQLNPRWHAS
ncbi:MAG: hypothetical protein L0221_02005 [Chloroflexi bacterium]|nr:hypothetical protein [Chloroflexota bacterium]